MSKEFHISNPIEKLKSKSFNFNQHREINLVPDVKDEMIKALKLRNFIFFLCIVISIASVGVTILFGTIAGGQQLAIDSKKSMIDNLSAKLNSYGDLDDFLTIKNQLSNISDITNNKKVLSRTFNILSALRPTGADTITISEMSVDLSGENPTLVFDAQANAGRPPYIDYNVLDSFKKSMKYMRYDYGEYVDKNGSSIPAYCMIETDSNGAFFTDYASKAIYAYWTINEEGCNPSASANESVEDAESTESQEDAESTESQEDAYELEVYNDIPVVRIWRTPQFNDWYAETPAENAPYISTDGNISNVPHFNSSCISYSAYKTSEYASNNEETVVATGDGLTWVSRNDSCLLVPDGDEGGIVISESSNGRDATEELVLRFSASILLAPEVYNFNNTHMLALAPSGRYNVTDSYVQIQAMFGERAKDCAKDDAACEVNGGN